jgi:hypothetical protein
MKRDDDTRARDFAAAAGLSPVSALLLRAAACATALIVAGYVVHAGFTLGTQLLREGLADAQEPVAWLAAAAKAITLLAAKCGVGLFCVVALAGLAETRGRLGAPARGPRASHVARLCVGSCAALGGGAAACFSARHLFAGEHVGRVVERVAHGGLLAGIVIVVIAFVGGVIERALIFRRIADARE